MSQNNDLRTSWARLAEIFSAGVLASVSLAEWVNPVLDVASVNSQRVCPNPAAVRGLECMGLSLYAERLYDSVFAAVARRVARGTGRPSPLPVANFALSKLRGKIGFDALRQLVNRCGKPHCDERRQAVALFAGCWSREAAKVPRRARGGVVV